MRTQTPNPSLMRRSAQMSVALFLTALIGLSFSARAQTATVIAQPIRVTVPVSSTDSNGVAFTATVTNVVSPVTFSVASLPAEAGYSFDTNNVTATASGVLTLNTTNISEGIHPCTFEATGGAANSLSLTLQSAHIWTGAGFTNGDTANFSAATNWAGGNIPGPASDVVLTDSGGVADADTTNNVWITTDAEIGSLRQAITSGGTRRHNIYIDPGVTFKITGSNCLSVLRDRSDTSQEWRLAFFGEQGTLVVSNQTADIRTFNTENQNGRLLLDGLGTLIADVNQIHISDYSVYPNYDNLKANGYRDAALPRRMPPGHNYLARTNIITCRFAGDPNDWSDPTFRFYSMVVGNNLQFGTTQRQPFRLGISNLFQMNSICFAHAGVSMDQGGAVVFNPAFTASNCVAIFRGADGGRMAMFALADNAGPGPCSSHSKAVVDFTGGTVDALVDRLYLSRNRTNASDASGQSVLTMVAGTFDVNNAIIGYQGQGNNQGTGLGYCYATLNVHTAAVFRVNQTLELGHTTADAGHATAAESGYGRIVMNGGGTLMASNITVGGVTKVSVNNDIILTSGSRLIVTNGMGEDIAGGRMHQLSMSDSSLTLHVADGDPHVFVGSLVTGGSGNTINIASMPEFPAYPAEVTLISFQTGSGNFTAGSMPSGLNGSIQNNANSIVLIVDTNAPQTLVWKGNVNGNWDFSTMNWVTADGTPTNFHNGDFVVFDDSASSASVTLSADVQPGQSPTAPGMTVSNNVLSYTFGAGGGSVQGSKLFKQGSSSLTLNAPMQSSLEVTEGTVMGTADIGSTLVRAGASLAYSGNINGGLTSAGTVSSAGRITGPLTLQGGSFQNLGYVNDSFTPGPMSVSSGVLITNAVGAEMAFSTSWTLSTNAVLANFGTIYQGGPAGGNGGLNVNFGGLLTGTGTISAASGVAIKDGRVSINDGGRLVLGGAPLGSMTILTRLDFMPGSTNIFRVNAATPASDVINTLEMNYRNGTILLDKTAGDYSAGQSFNLLNPVFGSNVPDNPTNNIYYLFVPAAPAFGLKWDHTDLVTYGALKTANITTTAVTLGSSTVFDGTNYTFTLSWPEEYIGWRLEGQTTNSLQVGLSTNWVTIANSFRTNQIIITIPTNNPPAISNAYNRLVYP